MLSLEDALPFLLERSLVSAESIVHGGLAITSAARRNRNLRVSRSDGPGYLIKQPDDPQAGGHFTLRAEASFYAFCQQEPAAELARASLPSMLFADFERALLAIELYEDAAQLWAHYRQWEADAFPFKTAAALGRALGRVHQTFRLPGLADNERLKWLRREPPWIMQVHKPGPELLTTLSPANYQTLKIVQTQQGLSGHLDKLLPLWQPTTVIHGDIKADNILVRPAPEASDAAPFEVRLIDWETVQLGDPAWDLAGALQDFLLFWVFSMNQAAPSPEEMAASARYPLPSLRPAMRALWRGYRSETRLDAAESNELLGRATRFSAARLIQSAYEFAQHAQALSVGSVLLLQLSANLLTDPETAQVQLYGLFQEVCA